MRTISKAPNGLKLKVKEHPGFHFNGVLESLFKNRYCIVNSNLDVGGAYYGHEARFFATRPFRTSCLSAFGEAEANRIVNAHNREVALNG